jgi:5-methyltetrahydrofolate--homocysteine methyltransferase
MSRVLEALKSGRVLLMDGAMGTELQRAGIGQGECYELWNLKNPKKVRAIHQAYVDAGAEVLLTNTFQALRVELRLEGKELRQTDRIILEGIRLAREAAGPECFVLADIGPTLENYSFEQLAANKPLASLVRSLCQADALLLETYSRLSVFNAVLFLDDVMAWDTDARPPILLSIAFHCDTAGQLQGIGGDAPERFAGSSMIAALGANCGRDIGMDQLLEVIRRYRLETDLPLFARPNAGTPTRVGDGWVYPLTPEKMAERLPELLEAGVSMVGGCCGTTPEHIAAMRPIIDEWNATHN